MNKLKLSLALPFLLALVALFAWGLSSPVQAQSGGTYSLTWSTIDNGGGTSTGGAYTLSGTIGQPDAGALSGGTYALGGGFWNSLLAALGNSHIYLPLVWK